MFQVVRNCDDLVVSGLVLRGYTGGMSNRGAIRGFVQQSAVAARPPGPPNQMPGPRRRADGDPAAATVPQSHGPNQPVAGPPQPPSAAPSSPRRVPPPPPRPEPTLGATALDRFDAHDTDAAGFNWRQLLHRV